MGYFSGIGRFWGVFLKVNYGIAIFSLKNTPFPLRHIYGKLRYFVPFILSAFSAFSFVTILFLIFYDWIFVACLVCFYLSFINISIYVINNLDYFISKNIFFRFAFFLLSLPVEFPI